MHMVPAPFLACLLGCLLKLTLRWLHFFSSLTPPPYCSGWLLSQSDVHVEAPVLTEYMRMSGSWTFRLGAETKARNCAHLLQGIKYLLMLLDHCGLPSWGWSSLKDLRNPQISTHLHTKFWTVVNGDLHLYHQTTNEGISFLQWSSELLKTFSWILKSQFALGFLWAAPLPMSWTFTDCSSLPITTRSTLDNVGFRLLHSSRNAPSFAFNLYIFPLHLHF